MRHSWAYIMIILILVVLAFSITTYQKKVEYSDNPADWVNTTEMQSNVDITQATKGEGLLARNGLKIINDKGHSVFTYDGLYNGIPFEKEYSEDKKIIEITPNLDPTDGIAQAFLVNSFENRWKTTIFIDEDFIELIKPINIVWGADFGSEKLFKLNRISEGIYTDYIYDDMSRFVGNARTGGILVGNVTVNDVKMSKTDGIFFVAMR